MKLSRLLAPIAAAAALLGAGQSAQAALILQVSSGGTTYTISDNGLGDVDSLLGGVGYWGTVGNWELAIASGSAELNPFSLHLSSIVKGNNGDAPITIKITQTGLIAGAGLTTVWSDGGGTGFGGASWAAYVDDADAAFGTTTMINSSTGYATDGASLAAALSGTYSATLVTTFDYRTLGMTGLRQSSLDVAMGVPEPASLALVGLGLLGAGAVRRRKANNA